MRPCFVAPLPGLSAIVVGLLGSTDPLLAQSSNPAPVQLEEITVTGEKVERRIQNTGASVAVTRENEITAKGFRSANEIFERTPNVQIANDGRDIVIRGVPKAGLAASEDVLTQSSGDVVTTFLDGVPISTWAGATSLWDIGQVEIFRGAQTTTSDRGSLGGAVFLRTIDPTPVWSAKARGSFGSYNTSGFSGSVSGPIVPGILGIRLSVDRQVTDGFIKNLTTRTLQDPQHQTTAHAKLVYDPGTGTRVDLSFTHSDRLKGGGLADITRFPQSYVSFANLPERLSKQVDVGSISFKHDLTPGWRLEGLTGLGVENAVRRLDGDATAFNLLRADVNEEVRQASQELRIVRDDPGGRWQGFLGLYGRSFERDAKNNITGLFNILTNVKTQTVTIAAFGETTYSITPQLRVTAGGRVESESFDTRFVGNSAKISDGVVVPLPKIALAYDWTPEITTIGTIQRAYRAGGAGQTLLSGTTYNYGPEYTWNYEAALRTRWLDNRLELNFNAFHVDWSDQQVQNRLNGNFLDSIILNAGRSQLQGLETEVRFKVLDTLTTFASLGLIETRFDRFVSNGVDYRGNEFPFASPYQIGAGFSYAHESGITLTSDLNYLGPAYSDVANTAQDKVKARILINPVLSYTWTQANWGKATASIIAKNLLDERYAYVRAFASNLVGIGERRTIAGELRVEF